MRRGMALTEMIMAIFIAAIAFYVFLTVFGAGARHAVQTRNRTAAIMLAQSLMDEIEAHPYGEPAPQSWANGVKEPVVVWVNGRPQQMKFTQQLTFQNRSFLGEAAGNSDLVTIRITWQEAVGKDIKDLEVRVPVWR